MKIKTLKLTNFRGVRDMTLELNANLNVLAGVNGAGKSTVLDAVAILLSQAVAKITDPDEQGKRIDVSDITTDEHYSLASASVENLGECYDWSVLRRRPGFEADVKVTVGGESDLAKPIRQQITETNAECSIPMMVFFPVNRVVDLPFKGKRIASEGALEAYEGALDGRANFWSFFEWFRERDDLAIENASGREWFIVNRSRLMRRVRELTTTFDRCAREAGLSSDKSQLIRDETSQLVRDWEFSVVRASSDMLVVFHRKLFDYLKEMAVEVSCTPLHGLVHDLQSTSSKMLHAFDTLPQDHLESGPIEKALSRLLRPAFRRMQDRAMGPFLPFVGELLSFTLDLGLWWISRDGRNRLRESVREYFPTSLRERGEWQVASHHLTTAIGNIVESELSRRRRTIGAEGRELRLVSKAITSFTPEFTDLRISRKPKPRMLVQKNNETFEIDQLSDGEKCLIAMIGDLARRLTIANPTLENPLEGEGVALIDEIDLHLHPKWQRMVVGQLVSTFPNVQFILSTHSPAVLSHVEEKSVFLLHQGDEGIAHTVLAEAYGQSYERLLEDVFGAGARPDEVDAELDELFDLIQRGRVEEAREKLDGLRRIGIDPELVRAEFLLHRKEDTAQ